MTTASTPTDSNATASDAKQLLKIFLALGLVFLVPQVFIAGAWIGLCALAGHAIDQNQIAVAAYISFTFMFATLVGFWFGGLQKGTHENQWWQMAFGPLPIWILVSVWFFVFRG